MRFTTQIIKTNKPSAELLSKLTPIARFENNPDLIWVEPEEEKTSISIDQVHSLQKEMGLKPFHETCKVAIIAPAHQLTLPAQQALLKLLEEPPENTLILLATAMPDKLLPTILSRGNLVIVEERESSATTPMYKELTEIRVAACLKKSDEWSKSREESLSKLRDLAMEIREKYHKTPTQILLSHEKAVIACIERLEKNVNAKLAIDHLLLALSGVTN